MKVKSNSGLLLPVVLLFFISFYLGAFTAVAKAYSQPSAPRLNPLKPETGDRLQLERLLAQNDNNRDAAREKWKNLTPEQKEALRERHKRWKNLSPEKKRPFGKNINGIRT